MNYELAKQLKDAGFPQKGAGSKIANPHAHDDDESVEITYAPTLEELIEACGDRFLGLLKHDDKSGWTALKNGDVLFLKDFSENPDLMLGSTPEEAVARLWLALNKK